MMPTQQEIEIPLLKALEKLGAQVINAVLGHYP